MKIFPQLFCMLTQNYNCEFNDTFGKRLKVMRLLSVTKRQLNEGDIPPQIHIPEKKKRNFQIENATRRNVASPFMQNEMRYRTQTVFIINIPEGRTALDVDELGLNILNYYLRRRFKIEKAQEDT